MFGRPTYLFLAFAILVLATLDVVSAAKSAGCGKNPTIGSQTYTTTVNGKQRQYIMKLPGNYDKNRAYRIIFLWHQRGGSATKIVNGENPNQGGVIPYYGLPPLSNNSAIFVVPNGLDAGWANSNNEDLTFYDTMLKTIEADLCVDTTLRFSTGFSYGAAMSYAIACARGKDTRAVAIISGALLSGCNGGNDPVAYYGQHGTSDSVLNVSNGRQIRDRFVKNNGCTAVSEPQPNGANSVKTVYKNCKEGYPMTWVIHNGDHNPSQTNSGSSTPFAPANTWEFFSQFVGDVPPAGTTTTAAGGEPTAKPTTTLVTSSKEPTTTTTAKPPTSTGGAAQYGQCGGQGWAGATTCASPFTCKYSNDYYSQCL